MLERLRKLLSPTVEENDFSLKLTFGKLGVNAVSLMQSRNIKFSNQVNTAKFTWLTWIPLSLLFQYKRVANIYFTLMIAIMFLEFSPKRPTPKLLSFIAVIGFTTLKDLYEDRERKKADLEVNKSKVEIYNTKKRSFEKTEFQSVEMGDICRVKRNNIFPADLLLIDSSDENRLAYISMASLNGETHLQERYAPLLLHKFQKREIVNEIIENGVQISLNSSDRSLEDFSGELRVKDEISQLSVDNVLYQGTSLHDVEYAIGIACFVGNYTKANRNRTPLQRKLSLLQKKLNLLVLGLISTMILAGVYFAIRGYFSRQSEFNIFLLFLIYLICFYAIVPISLYSVFEIIKLAMARQINTSKQMKRYENGSSHQAIFAKTGDTLDDLGQLNYIFLDKTGTLTKNEMFLRYVAFLNFQGDLIRGGKFPKNKIEDKLQFEESENFFLGLCLCNSLKITSEGDYVGISSDEKALVEGCCESAKICLISRKKKREKSQLEEYRLVNFRSKIREFQILHTFDFNSERKRMSVIVKEKGEIKLFCKGADEVLEKRLTKELQTSAKEEIIKQSSRGLRNFVFAHKSIDEKDYEIWLSQYRELVDSRQKAEVENWESQLETQLTFSGISSLEDELQENVGLTIERLKTAHIQPWVLTGDHVETAVAVAYACNLFSKNTQLEYLTRASNFREISELLDSLQIQLTTTTTDTELDFGLVMNGDNLKIILADEELSKIFFESTKKVKTCLCARLSPIQKSQIVKLIKKFDPRAVTAAIGDGANDVGMINEAHIGIGIRGKEDQKAALVADYALDEFQLVSYLILHYGRQSYLRLSTMLGFFFYKNVMMVFPELIWAHQNGFTGEVAFPDILLSIESPFFMTLPLLVASVVEFHLPKEISIENPSLYHDGPDQKYFNFRLMIFWILLAFLHGSLIWTVPFYSIMKGSLPESVRLGPDGVCDRSSGDCTFSKGDMSAQYSLSSLTAFIVLNLVTHYKLCILTRIKRLLTLGAIVVSLILLVICIILGDLFFQDDMRGISILLFYSNPLLLIFFLPFAILAFDFIFAMYKSVYKPSLLELLQRESRKSDKTQLLI